MWNRRNCNRCIIVLNFTTSSHTFVIKHTISSWRIRYSGFLHEYIDIKTHGRCGSRNTPLLYRQWISITNCRSWVHGDNIGTNISWIYVISHWWVVNTLRPRQNGRHLAGNIFIYIFLNENVWISIKISLKTVPKGTIGIITWLCGFWREITSVLP